MTPCGEDTTPVEKPAWTPAEVGGASCVDWLIYHTNQTGDWEVFRLGELPGHPDANPNLTQGVGPRVSDIAPSRSPDMEWIAFTSNRDGNWEIYVASADGSRSQRVTFNTTAPDLDPVWSPTGQYIAYESVRDGNWEIYMVNVVTGAETRLTDDPANDINPFWSPDGRKLVFESDRDGQWQLYELAVSTLSVRLLSDGAGDDHDPQYSSDGEQIVLRSYRNGERSTIYVMTADGTASSPISDPSGEAANATWSADDQLIAYQSDADGDQEIYAYDLDSEQTRQVTANDVDDYAPTWLCSSPVLVFTSNVTGDSNLYETPALPIDAPSIEVEGDATQLTSESASDQYPENAPAEENASRQGALPPSSRNR